MPLVAAALAGVTGIALGAFGAHALRARLDEAQLAIWHTAVLYHLIHALALLALALFARATGRSVVLPSALFTAGIALFSGSLYLLALTGWRWLGPLTPLGGVAFLVGWLSLLWLARAPH
ncbi:MAG TPA: DUF423 domain-containing protein [Kofleriaceae bacterium]|nr:DUF423 domain-containing protein [Kofleriaceae bacterium]